MRYFVYALLSLGIFALDAFSKALVIFHIKPGFLASPIPVFQGVLGIDFSITHVANKGAAWGLFSSMPQLLTLFRLVFVGGLIAYLIFAPQAKKIRLPLLLVITGAVSNLFDIFLYGHVVDFFHFTFWGYSFPVFNIADSTIFCGLIALLIVEGRHKRHAPIT